MSVWQKPFRHGHRQVRDTGALDERTYLLIRLRVGSPFAENDERTLGRREKVDGARDRLGRRNLTWRRIDNFHE